MDIYVNLYSGQDLLRKVENQLTALGDTLITATDVEYDKRFDYATHMLQKTLAEKHNVTGMALRSSFLETRYSTENLNESFRTLTLHYSALFEGLQPVWIKITYLMIPIDFDPLRPNPFRYPKGSIVNYQKKQWRVYDYLGERRKLEPFGWEAPYLERPDVGYPTVTIYQLDEENL